MGTGSPTSLRSKIGAYIWRRKVSILDDELFKMMAGLGKLPSPIEDAAADLIRHAANNIYMGQVRTGVGGMAETFAGWPLSELLDKLPDQSIRVQVLAEIKRRCPMPSNALGVQSGQQRSRGSRPFTLNERMAARMHWGTFEAGSNNTWAPGFEHMAIHRAGDKVFVWVISKGGEAITLEDEAGLFPSDAMVTKLRLLEKT